MDRLRILTLNIWNRQGPWDERLALIRAGIRALSPDVVGLQEVLERDGVSQADDIREGLGYEAAFRVFPLPIGTAEEHRSLLLAEIASPQGKLPFFTTHLNWKFHHGVVREQQVVVVAGHMKAEAPTSGLPPVLVGDFNAEPEAAEIRFLKGLQSLDGQSTFLADCFGQTGEGPGITYDAVRNPFAAPSHEHPRRIDYVFVRGPDNRVRGKPLHARVVMEEVVGGIAASDHYGVYAEITI
jgi:endonuclease/exonuclease/phosphatase family metal-dependent hydrolase